MALRGITVPIVERLGKIKIGYKDKSGIPHSLNHFLIKNTTEQVEKQFKTIYGNKPKQIKIFFPSDNLNHVLRMAFKRYSFDKLVCMGIGEEEEPKKCLCETLKGKDNHKHNFCSGVNCPTYMMGLCKPVLNMYFGIVGITHLGIFQLDSTSYMSMSLLESNLRFIQTHTQRLTNIVFDLRVEMENAEYTDEKGLHSTKVPRLHITTNLENIKSGVKFLTNAIKQIDLSNEEPEDLDQEEFYPESSEEERKQLKQELNNRVKFLQLTKTEVEELRGEHNKDTFEGIRNIETNLNNFIETKIQEYIKKLDLTELESQSLYENNGCDIDKIYVELVNLYSKGVSNE